MLKSEGNIISLSSRRGFVLHLLPYTPPPLALRHLCFSKQPLLGAVSSYTNSVCVHSCLCCEQYWFMSLCRQWLSFFCNCLEYTLLYPKVLDVALQRTLGLCCHRCRRPLAGWKPVGCTQKLLVCSWALQVQWLLLLDDGVHLSLWLQPLLSCLCMRSCGREARHPTGSWTGSVSCSRTWTFRDWPPLSPSALPAVRTLGKSGMVRLTNSWEMWMSCGTLKEENNMWSLLSIDIDSTGL